MDDDHPSPDVPCATAMSFHVCSHGHLFVRLLDGAGGTLGVAVLNEEEFLVFVREAHSKLVAAGEAAKAMVEAEADPSFGWRPKGATVQ
jgi:hypothetical protein